MTPTRTQRFFANEWPLRIAVVASALGVVSMTIWFCLPTLRWNAWSLAWFGFLLLVSAVLGVLVGAIGFGMLLSPLIEARERLNGAPFRVGDSVMILRGARRGRVATVYEVWGSRCQVRLDLGPEERARVVDVYGYIEVCRIR